MKKQMPTYFTKFKLFNIQFIFYKTIKLYAKGLKLVLFLLTAEDKKPHSVGEPFFLSLTATNSD